MSFTSFLFALEFLRFRISRSWLELQLTNFAAHDNAVSLAVILTMTAWHLDLKRYRSLLILHVKKMDSKNVIDVSQTYG